MPVLLSFVFIHACLLLAATKNVVLGECVRRQDGILTELVMEWSELVHLVVEEVRVAVEHAQRVMRISTTAFASGLGQLMPTMMATTHVCVAPVEVLRDVFKAIVGGKIVAISLLLLVVVMMHLALNQVFNFALGELGGRMSPVRLPHHLLS